MKVIFIPEVLDYLDELGKILYAKNYFSFYEDACEYIDKLIDEIQLNIHKRPKKASPSRFRKYGSHYIIYKSNKRTTWYIIFVFKNGRYIVRHITNNHVSGHHIEAPE